VSASSHNAVESDPANRVISSGGSLGQSNTLLGLGQNEQLLHTFSTSTADLQPLVGDPLVGIRAGAVPLFEAVTDSVEFSRLLTFDAYESFQDGQLFALGVLREYFVCQHLDGSCDECFETADELEEHFETAHFEFTRLKPSYRYICSKCNGWNNALTPRCQQCHADGHVEVWVYGNYIQTRFYQRFPPDGHDPFKMEASSLPPFLPSYSLPGTGSPLGPGPGGVTGFNGGTNPGGYNYQNHNGYQAPDAPGYGFDAYGSPPSGGYQNRDSEFLECQSEVTSPSSISYRYSIAVRSHHRYKLMLVSILLLLSMAGMVGIRQLLNTKAQSFQSWPILPVIGFVGALASFLVGYTFWSAKHFGVHTYGAQCVSTTSRIYLAPD
jgi:hypothetical protein